MPSSPFVPLSAIHFLTKIPTIMAILRSSFGCGSFDCNTSTCLRDEASRKNTRTPNFSHTSLPF